MRKFEFNSDAITNSPLPIIVRDPTLNDFDDWWERSFNRFIPHPPELFSILRAEWVEMNGPPNLSYIALQNINGNFRAVSFARFIFVRSGFLEFVRTQREGHINTTLMQNKLPNGISIRLSCEEFNKLNDRKHGFDCVISALDFYRGPLESNMFFYFSHLFHEFLIDTKGWQIRNLFVTDFRQNRVSSFYSLGFKTIHRLSTEGKKDRLLVLDRRQSIKRSSVLYPILDPIPSILRLSKREREVLYLSIHDLSNSQIADFLNIKPTSVEYYKKKCREKAAILHDGEIPSFARLKRYVRRHPEELRIVLQIPDELQNE